MGKVLLRALAVSLLAAGLIAWGLTGANPGWTKTRVPVTTLDEVTGIEGIAYEKKFKPGLDFLACAVVVSSLLAAASLFMRKKPTPVAVSRI